MGDPYGGWYYVMGCGSSLGRGLAFLEFILGQPLLFSLVRVSLLVCIGRAY